MNKLTWFNAEYVRRLSAEEYEKIATPWLQKALGEGELDLKRLCELLQPRTEVFNQLPEMVDFLAEMPSFDKELYTHKKMKTNEETSLEALKAVLPVLEALDDFSEQGIHDALFSLIEKLGVKNGWLLWPVRVAVSGKQFTPGGGVEICAILGKDETLRRLRAGLEKLN